MDRKKRLVVELSNGDAYMGLPGGEEEIDGDEYLILEQPKKIHIAGADPLKDTDRIKILKEQVERVRDLEDI